MDRRRVLFVDDDPNILRAYERSLRPHRDHWECEFVVCPLEAWQRIQTLSLDTVVSDIRMPGMTGLELLSKIRQLPATADLPVVIVTGESDRKLKRQALDLDASDLLNKPVDSEDLIARLKSTLRTKDYSDQLKQQNEILEQKVQQRTADLVASRTDIIWRLGKAAELRDEETGNHVIRVGSYSRAVARKMGADDSFAEKLYLAAPLHDIGKIGIPDSVLLKPGKLSDAEWRIMRSHCEIGHAILTDRCKLARVAEELRLSENPIIDLAALIAISHHEKWDGGGYPNGLSGDAIPLAGRIVAIADVYDALRSDRPYKTAFSVEKSLDILEEGSGTHFDPEIVSAFFAAFEEIRQLECELNDASSESVQQDADPQPALIG